MNAQDRSPVLTLQHVSMQFGAKTVLRDLNVAIDRGEFIGLIGQNGAGKTTLLRIILGLLAPTRGQIEVLGEPVTKGNRRIGYVPQKIHWEPDTPLRGRDVAGLGLDGHRFGFPLPSYKRRARIEEALRAVDALAFADAPVGTLSGGQQQRLLIAQALLTDPEILLLDEPLANLDMRSAREVVRLVSSLQQQRGVAVILVAHDMNPLLDVMDRILYLADGRAAMGPVSEIVQSHVLTQLYGYPIDVLRVRNRILVVSGRDADIPDWLVSAETHCDGGGDES